MYERFYNLSGKPFRLNPDSAFFYASSGHRRAMAYLEYGLHQGEGFIVITGEVGAGKTTLVRNLFDQLDNHRRRAVQLVSTQLDANDMLRAVCSAFGLRADGSKAMLLFNLEAHLMDLQRAGQSALLVVDEAQNLEPSAVEELRMLSNFQTSRGSLLQSFLLGQPEFRETLQSPSMRQLRQRVIATYHLGAMSAEETRAYIEHRLRRVGWMEDPQLTDDAFVAIHEASEGVPRRINTTCDRLLLMGFLEELHSIDRSVVDEVTREIEQDFNAPRQPVADEAEASAAMEPDTDSDPPETDSPPERPQQIDSRNSRLDRYTAYTANLSRRILSLVNPSNSS